MRPPRLVHVSAERYVVPLTQPRKSAIRATPQVFVSPSGLGPNPEHAHIRVGAHSNAGEGQADAMAPVDERLASPGLPNPFATLYRASSVSPVKAEAVTDDAVPPMDAEADMERKRRRVTFSAFQEHAYVYRLTQCL